MSTPRPCAKCGRDYFPLRRGYCHRCDMRRRAMVGYQCSYVDAEPARLHIKELREAGVGLRQIARLAGLNRKQVQILVNGRSDRGTPPSHRVSRKTAEAILAIPVPEVPHTAVAGGERVDAIGTIRRCQALVAFGYTRTYLGSRIGWSVANMGRLLDPATGKVNADTARRVDALFRELQLTPGPSSRARNEGRRRGWELPMAWDEDELDRFVVGDDRCDEPVEEPAQLHFAERYVEMRDQLGLSDTEIAARMGIEVESLERQKYRHAARIELERTATEGGLAI